MIRFVQSKAKLCAILEQNKVTLDKYLAMVGAPEKGKKGWSVQAVNDFIKKNALSEVILTKSDSDIKNLKSREIIARCKRAEFQLDVEQGKYTANEKIRESILIVAERQKEVLYQKLRVEYPPRVEGLNAAEIEKRGVELADEICRIFHEGARQWIQS